MKLKIAIFFFLLICSLSVKSDNSTSLPVNYYCTWYCQNIKSEGLKDSTVRDVLNHHSLFGTDGWAVTYYPEVRSQLLFMLDDGWDLPFDGRKKQPEPYFGCQEISESKFPDYGNTPEKRLCTMVANVKAAGWKGAGIWICAQEDDANYKKDKWNEEFWRERLKWSKKAGISYWKVDWGRYCGDVKWRRFLSLLAKKVYPQLIIEHAIPCGPLNDFENGQEGTDSYYDNAAPLLEFSDVYRTYDCTWQLSIPTTLSRIGSLLTRAANSPVILNGEDELYICSALGLSMGIMRFPFVMQDYAPGILTSRPINRMIDEVTRAVRWQQLSPPYRSDENVTKVSGLLLSDDYTYRKGDTWFTKAVGKHVSQSAPASVSRGMDLPVVETSEGSLPYVVASRHPNGNVSVATLGRVSDKLGGFRNVEANVSIKTGPSDAKQRIGVFGYYKTLTLMTGKDMTGTRVMAHDLLLEAPVDITSYVTIEKERIVIPGNVLRTIGLAGRTANDCSEPGLVMWFE